MKYLALLLLLAGCSSVKEVPIHTTTEKTVTIHDTIIKVRLVRYVDSVVVKDTTSYLKNQYAESRATFSDGFLTHTLKITPDPIAINVKFPTITKKISKEVPIVIKKELSLFQQIKLIARHFFIFSFLLLLVFMVYRFFF